MQRCWTTDLKKWLSPRNWEFERAKPHLSKPHSFYTVIFEKLKSCCVESTRTWEVRVWVSQLLHSQIWETQKLLCRVYENLRTWELENLRAERAKHHLSKPHSFYIVRFEKLKSCCVESMRFERWELENLRTGPVHFSMWYLYIFATNWEVRKIWSVHARRTWKNG